MSFSLANQIRINNKAASLDIRYGPWLTEAAAKAGILQGLREKGLTVGIYVPNNNTNSPVVEYWWKDGVTDNDLILKTAGVELTTVTNYLSTNNVLLSGARLTTTAAFGTSRALGRNSLAVGDRTVAQADYSTTIGFETSALKSGTLYADGEYSFVGGLGSVAKDRFGQFVFGQSSKATHDFAVALGSQGLASGPRSHMFGVGAIASGYESNAEGVRTGTGNRVPFQSYNAATKTFTFAPEHSAVFFGEFFGNLQCTIRGCLSGLSNSNEFHNGGFFDVQIQSNTLQARTANNTLSTLGVFPLSGGEITWNLGSGIGWLQNGSGWESHAEGYESIASGFRSSHAEGRQTLASGAEGSHAEGYITIASGQYGSHAEGNQTIASGNESHAEGKYNRASGHSSHAEGAFNTASGYASHAEGENTRARGQRSHSAGSYSEAAHDQTWVWRGSTATSYLSTTRANQFMVSAEGGSAFFGSVGIGTDSIANALTVSGDISANGNINVRSSTIPLSVLNIAANRVFSDVDTNKVFHFDTTSAVLSAMFPSTLSEGFNVAIMNTGTRILNLSTGPNLTYKALSNKLIDQYSGAYVYKSGSDLFAIGGL